MKHIKNFKLFEAGEWACDVDWDYVKNNPDDDSEESGYIKAMENLLNEIIDFLDNKNVFKIVDIRGFDLYQGAYGIVKIFGRNYEIWGMDNYELWIEDFPIDNTSDDHNKPGFKGGTYEIYEMLNDINKNGGDINLYKNSKKYNL